MSLLRAILCLLLGWCTFTAVEGKFDVYWNMPLDICTDNGVTFDLDQFSIIHNTGNAFFGDEVNILYNPGRFPQYDENDVTINGGIPQRGNFTAHVEHFTNRLLQVVPRGFSGPAVLDYETYLPSYDISLPHVYKTESEAWVKAQHPDWTINAVRAEARRTFNEDVKPYFESLLRVGLDYRPDALIGYYHFPYCHNYKYPHTHCNRKVMALNDQLKHWLFNTSTALYPSVYTFLNGYNATSRANYITAALRETVRVNDANRPILPYFWYKWHDSPEFLPADVARSSLWFVRSLGSSGVVVWGSKKDLKDKRACLDFKSYLYGTLGPLLKCFHDMPDSIVNSLKRRYPTWADDEHEDTDIGTHENDVQSESDEEVTELTDVEREIRKLQRIFDHEQNRNMIMNRTYYYCDSLNLV